MRITIVSRIFAPEASAASQRLGSLATALARRGDRVAVITARAPRAAATPHDGSLRVSRWPVIRDRTGYVRGYLPYLSFDIPAFFRVLCAPRFDILVVEPPPTTGTSVRLAAALRRRPYVYYAADIWSVAAAATGAPGVITRAVRTLEAFALRGAAAVLAVSPGVAGRVTDLAPDSVVTVVGHGVDDSVYHRGVPATDRDAADLVYIGTASEWHGAGVFIDALAILDERGIRPRVAFVGGGSEWDLLRESARSRGLHGVTFSPPVEPAAAASLLAGSRAALASLRTGVGYDFAVPTKMYSALAVGTPVVFAGPDELRALVDDERLGWGCAPDAETVAAALEASLAAPPSERERERLAAWAKDAVSARAVADRAAEVIDEVARVRMDTRR